MAGYVIGPDNQVLSDGVNKYTYDADGNETTKTNIATGDQWTYSYNNKDQLTKAVEKTSGGMLELEAVYHYDVFGNRLEKDVYTPAAGMTITKFAVDGWNPAKGAGLGNKNWNVWADLNADGSFATRYIHGDAVDQLFARMGASGHPRASAYFGQSG